MVVIEDEGKLKFFDGKKELTLREGFARLDTIYGGEPQETKRVINRLKEKYMKDLTNRQVFYLPYVRRGQSPLRRHRRPRAE